jgi:lipopolysaccharide exporter
MSQTLTSQTLKGVQWTSIATIVTSVTQIGSMSVMARLLEPAAFGLIAISGIILRFASYFANMGMTQALIQKEELTNDSIRAAFTSSVFLSIFFYSLIWLTAPLATQLLGNPEVIPIVRAMGLNFVFGGLSSTAHAILRRQMNFKSLVIIEVFSYIVAYVGVQIVLAYLGFGVWSLVFAALSQTLVSGIACYFLVRHSVYLSFKWAHYKPLLSYGGRISFVGFLEFLGSNLDGMLISRLSGASVLGLYNRAYMLIQLPIQSLTSSISRVLFPALSTIQSQTERLKKVYLSTVSFVGFIILPACVGASVAAEQLVLILLGDKWIEAIPIFRILAFATPFNLLSHFGGIFCDANGALNPKIILQIIHIIILATLLYILKSYGLIGYAYAIVAAELLRFIAYIFITKSFLKFDFNELIKTYLPAITTALIVGTAMYIGNLLFKIFNIPVLLHLIMELLLGAFLLIIVLILPVNKLIRKELNEKFLSKIQFLQNKHFFNILFK